MRHFPECTDRPTETTDLPDLSMSDLPPHDRQNRSQPTTPPRTGLRREDKHHSWREVYAALHVSEGVQ